MYIPKVNISPILALLFIAGTKAQSLEQEIDTAENAIPQSVKTLAYSPSLDQIYKPPALDTFAMPPCHCPPPFPPTISYLPILMAILSSDIGLTDSQIETLHELKDNLIEKSQPIILNRLIKQHEMSNLLTKDNIDKLAVKQVQQEINDQEAILANLLADHVLSVMQVLTPSQRKIVKIESFRRELDLFGDSFGKLHRDEAIKEL